MNIRGILLEAVGTLVGFVVGLIIGGLVKPVGLPGDFVPIVWVLSAIAGGYLTSIGAIPMKALFYLALVLALLFAAVILFPTWYFFGWS
jgi:hypothetical protein